MTFKKLKLKRKLLSLNEDLYKLMVGYRDGFIEKEVFYISYYQLKEEIKQMQNKIDKQIDYDLAAVGIIIGSLLAYFGHIVFGVLLLIISIYNIFK
jgi:hypothetical protein